MTIATPNEAETRRRVPPTPARPAAPPRGRGFRGGDAALERHDRQDAGAGRAADRHGGRRDRRRVCARPRPPAVGARRRPQHRRHRAGRRGPDRGHVAAPRGPRGPRGADRDRAGRVHAGRCRPRDAAARAGRAVGVHLRGRRRGIDARRRSGLPDPSVRVDGRQPARGRDRHRRRQRPPRQPRRECRPVLGDPRRRRQPRHRHVVHVPSARGRPDRLRRADRLALRARRRDPEGLPRRSRPRRHASWRRG